MANNTVDLVLRIKDNASKGLKDVTDESKKLGSSITDLGKNKGLDELKNKFDNLQKSLESAGAGMQKWGAAFSVGITAPIMAAGAGVMAMVSHIGNLASSLTSLEAQTGLSTDTLQELNYTADVSGTTTDNLRSSISTLTANLRAGGEQSVKFTRALDAIGVSTRDSSGKLRSMDALFPEIISNLQDVEDVTTRNSLALQIFGGSANDLIPLLGLTSEEFAALRQEAHDLGVVLDRDALIAADNFRGEMTSLRAEFTAVFQNLALDLIPTARTMADLFRTNVAPAIRDVAERVRGAIDWFNNLSDAGQKTVIAALAITAALPPLVTAIGSVTSAVGLLRGALTALALMNPLGWVAIAAGALISLGAALYFNRSNNVATAADYAAIALDGAEAAADRTGTAMSELNRAVAQNDKNSALSALESLRDNVDTSLIPILDDLIAKVKETGAEFLNLADVSEMARLVAELDAVLAGQAALNIRLQTADPADWNTEAIREIESKYYELDAQRLALEKQIDELRNRDSFAVGSPTTHTPTPADSPAGQAAAANNVGLTALELSLKNTQDTVDRHLAQLALTPKGAGNVFAKELTDYYADAINRVEADVRQAIEDNDMEALKTHQRRLALVKQAQSAAYAALVTPPAYVPGVREPDDSFRPNTPYVDPPTVIEPLTPELLLGELPEPTEIEKFFAPFVEQVTDVALELSLGNITLEDYTRDLITIYNEWILETAKFFGFDSPLVKGLQETRDELRSVVEEISEEVESAYTPPPIVGLPGEEPGGSAAEQLRREQIQTQADILSGLSTSLNETGTRYSLFGDEAARVRNETNLVTEALVNLAMNGMSPTHPEFVRLMGDLENLQAAGAALDFQGLQDNLSDIKEQVVLGLKGAEGEAELARAYEDFILGALSLGIDENHPAVVEARQNLQELRNSIMADEVLSDASAIIATESMRMLSAYHQGLAQIGQQIKELSEDRERLVEIYGEEHDAVVEIDKAIALLTNNAKELRDDNKLEHKIIGYRRLGENINFVAGNLSTIATALFGADNKASAFFDAMNEGAQNVLGVMENIATGNWIGAITGAIKGVISFVQRMADLFTPAWKKVARELEKELNASVRSALAGAFRDYLSGATNMREFLDAVEKGIYSSVLDAIIGAIIEAALIEGALSEILAKISEAAAKGQWDLVATYVGQAGRQARQIAKDMEEPMRRLRQEFSGVLTDAEDGADRMESRGTEFGEFVSAAISIPLYSASYRFSDATDRFVSATNRFSDVVDLLTTQGITVHSTVVMDGESAAVPMY